ncbi:PKD domain-containing protein, partial [bacterium]|nr:PKD domain-containing protein [bacterium]
GYDWVSDISYGDYSVPEPNMIEFIDWGNCPEMMGQYSYSLNGDSMDLFLIYDDCLQRVQYLTGSTFIKKPDFGGGMMNMAGCPGDKVLFKIAGGSSYEWHFGDGSPVSNEQYPIHVYAAAGDYDAFVVAMNSCGRTDTIHTFVKIGTTNVPNAHFGFDGWDFSRLEPIQFQYENNWLDQAGNNSYFWEFGDGTTSTLKDPVHAYERNGDYTIRLTVTNSCGSNTSTQMIYIKDAILNCEAKIQIDSVVSRTVYFRDISRGDISNWFWDFGDGFTSAQQDPVHTYDYDGIFFACLSVHDSLDDCAHQFCRQVEIGTQLCIANFTANVNQATNRVQFTDLSTNTTEWFWDFGDGNFSDLKDPL